MFKKFLSKSKNEEEVVVEEEVENKQKDDFIEFIEQQADFIVKDFEEERRRKEEKEKEKNMRVSIAVNTICNSNLGKLREDGVKVEMTLNESSIVSNMSTKRFFEKHFKIDELPDDEYIWVEGYKGTNSEMMCRDYQFELNKEYTIEGEPKICSNGFHFCIELKDVFDYYTFDTIKNYHNRYFKVKCLVKKEDYIRSKFGYLSFDEQGYDSYHWSMRGRRDYNPERVESFKVKLKRTDKLVAKSVVFLEELGYNDFKEIFKNNEIPISNERAFMKIKNDNISVYDYVLIEKKAELGKYLSTTLATVVVNDVEKAFLASHHDMRGALVKIDNRLNKLIGLLETEEVSKEMALYLFMK